MNELLAAASEARGNAYAPYSNYLVGAAVQDERGTIHVGCNVENISYGGTICAEQAAICRMISEGGKRVAALAVVTPDGGSPCGICRQVISEFSDELTVVYLRSPDEDSDVTTCLFDELLPNAFKSNLVTRTEEA